jgi:hypothetical protein
LADKKVVTRPRKSILLLGLLNYWVVLKIIKNEPKFLKNNWKINDKRYLLQLFEKSGKSPDVKEDKIEFFAVITAIGPTYFVFQLC